MTLPDNDNAGTILVVDDNPQNVELIEAYLEAAGYCVVVANDGYTALERVEGNGDIDLVILDIMMPNLSGYEVCEQLKGSEETRLIPIIMLTALRDLPDKLKGFEVGADEFLSKPFNQLELLTRVRTLLKAKRLNDNLESARNVILTLSLAVEAHDPYVKGHSQRVADYFYRLAVEVGLKDSLENLVHAAILHDIGKLGISQAILHKPGPLSAREFAEIQRHPVIGEKICEPLKFTSINLPIIRHHHERYDGRGYPDGLKGEEIPLGARIMAVADAYDAMVSNRAYRHALSKKTAVSILKEEAGKQWDRDLVETFITMIGRNGDQPPITRPDYVDAASRLLSVSFDPTQDPPNKKAPD